MTLSGYSARVATCLSLIILVALASRAPSYAQSDKVSAVRAVATLISLHATDMRRVPSRGLGFLTRRPAVLPLHTLVDPATFARLKAEAARNPFAPSNPNSLPADFAIRGAGPSTLEAFLGMADSTTICPIFGPPFGCQPPDMALAASPQWAMQGVNTSFAVFSTNGGLQPGWPKNAQDFFGVPNPGPCSPTGPVFFDPRAFFDPNDGRFWAAIIEIEGGFKVNSCPFQSRIWIAVSQTSNPNGAWNVYSFDTSLGTHNVNDYTQFGFDSRAVYFSFNMFSRDGTFRYAEIFGADKARMESGLPVSAQGLANITVNNAKVLTLQPVETVEPLATAPSVEFLAASFYGPSSATPDYCKHGCSGIMLFAFANVLTTPSLSEVTVPTSVYTMAPQADQPGCTQCIETFDTRISATPVFRAGLISLAVETGVNNGTAVVPGILWAQIQPTLSGTTLTGGSVFQSGLLSFSGRRAATFGALMPDNAGDLFMVFDSMSPTLNPSAYYTARRVTAALGTLGVPIRLQAGFAPTIDSRWGDYEAASFDGFSTNHVWLATQFSGANQDWATVIGETAF